MNTKMKNIFIAAFILTIAVAGIVYSKNSSCSKNDASKCTKTSYLNAKETNPVALSGVLLAMHNSVDESKQETVKKDAKCCDSKSEKKCCSKEKAAEKKCDKTKKCDKSAEKSSCKAKQ